MDPAGVFMLQSIRGIFEILKIKFDDDIRVEAEEFIGPDQMLDAIINQKKSPVVTAHKEDLVHGGFPVCHAMVATGIKEENQKYFVQCKNTYGDDGNQAVTFQLIALCQFTYDPNAMSHII